MKRLCTATISGLVFACQASFASEPPKSSYVGQEQRGIKALSEQDVNDLRAGRGMGLSKVAELNSFPGPAHVLELARALDLSDSQRTGTREIFEHMQVSAQKLGPQIIANEEALDSEFKAGRPDPVAVKRLIAESAALQGRLRAVHVAAHLETATLLSDAQIRA